MEKHKKPQHHAHDATDEIKEEFGEAADVIKDIQKTKKLNVKKEFMTALDVLMLKKDKINKISASHQATTPALMFIIAGSVALYLGIYLSWPKSHLLTPSLGYFVINALIYFVISIITIFIIDLVANLLFKGKGKFGELFRVLGYGNVVLIAGLLPALGGLAHLWYIVIVYKAIEQVKKLSIVNNIVTIVLGLVLAGLVSYLLSFIFGYGPMHLFSGVGILIN